MLQIVRVTYLSNKRDLIIYIKWVPGVYLRHKILQYISFSLIVMYDNNTFLVSKLYPHRIKVSIRNH